MNTKAIDMREAESTSTYAVPVGTWTYDNEYGRFYVDHLGREILGLSQEPEWFDLEAAIANIHPQYASSLRWFFRGDHSEALLLTVRVDSQDGMPRYVNLRADSGDHASGVESLHGTVFESAGGKSLRNEIVSARVQFDALAGAIPNAFLYLTVDLHVEFVSKVLADRLGKSTYWIVGRHLREVLGSEEFAQHADALNRALLGESVEYESQVASPNGPPVVLRISTSPVYDGLGDLIGVVSQATDITDLKGLEAEARRREGAFRMLAEGVPNHLLFLDPNMCIEFANQSFLDAAGWTFENARGKHMREIIGAAEFERRRPNYERALAGESFSVEMTGAVEDTAGRYRFSYRPGYGEDGHVRGLFSTAIDVSDRYRAELALAAKHKELERSNSDLEQFAYVASHDLKSPLRAIELLVGWIKDSLASYEDPDVRENLDLLARRTQRLSRLLDDLLDYSRAGRKLGDRRMTDVRALIRDVIELCSPPSHIDVSIEGDMPELLTFQTPLEQVFRNLIGNAIKHYSGTEGRITVSCQDEGEFVTFAVEDNGDGISPQYAEKVFQMFQTLQPRDKVEGSGMGLAIVRRIVTLQGGRVWFEAAASGSGTVFKFQWAKTGKQSETIQ